MHSFIHMSGGGLWYVFFSLEVYHLSVCFSHTVKIPNRTKELILKELTASDPNQKILALEKYQALWRFRYQVRPQELRGNQTIKFFFTSEKQRFSPKRLRHEESVSNGIFLEKIFTIFENKYSRFMKHLHKF